jgi:hypothetical protein
MLIFKDESSFLGKNSYQRKVVWRRTTLWESFAKRSQALRLLRTKEAETFRLRTDFKSTKQTLN